MGSCVLEPGRAAQLCGDRILWDVSDLARRSLMIFVKIFRADSSRVIGLVMLMLFSQSCGLGIG